MSKSVRILVVLLIVLAFGGVLFLKGQKETPSAVSESDAQASLPRLIDLSTSNCPACKAILPHVEQLGKDYAGVLDVQVVDVWENPALGEKYQVRYVPTLVLLDAKGEILERREGYMPPEDLEAMIEAHGIVRPGADS
jgi:thioredoxin 1